MGFCSQGYDWFDVFLGILLWAAGDNGLEFVFVAIHNIVCDFRTSLVSPIIWEFDFDLGVDFDFGGYFPFISVDRGPQSGGIFIGVSGMALRWVESIFGIFFEFSFGWSAYIHCPLFCCLSLTAHCSSWRYILFWVKFYRLKVQKNKNKYQCLQYNDKVASLETYLGDQNVSRCSVKNVAHIVIHDSQPSISDKNGDITPSSLARMKGVNILKTLWGRFGGWRAWYDSWVWSEPRRKYWWG